MMRTWKIQAIFLAPGGLVRMVDALEAESAQAALDEHIQKRLDNGVYREQGPHRHWRATHRLTAYDDRPAITSKRRVPRAETWETASALVDAG